MPGMADTTTPIAIKKTAKARKSTATITSDTPSSEPVSKPKIKEDHFIHILTAIRQLEDEFSLLQKTMAETREEWDKDRERHAQEISERTEQEVLARKREQETYEYETKRQRIKAEDEFAERKAIWERELALRKDELAQEKKELEVLRKQVAGFDMEKAKAVKEASDSLQKELTAIFVNEKKLREQEVKAEKDIFILKVTSLTQETNRQGTEIVELKRALDGATAQLKDVAVKVIEAGNNSLKSSNTPMES